MAAADNNKDEQQQQQQSSPNTWLIVLVITAVIVVIAIVVWKQWPVLKPMLLGAAAVATVAGAAAQGGEGVMLFNSGPLRERRMIYPLSKNGSVIDVGATLYPLQNWLQQAINFSNSADVNIVRAQNALIDSLTPQLALKGALTEWKHRAMSALKLDPANKTQQVALGMIDDADGRRMVYHAGPMSLERRVQPIAAGVVDVGADLYGMQNWLQHALNIAAAAGNQLSWTMQRELADQITPSLVNNTPIDEQWAWKRGIVDRLGIRDPRVRRIELGIETPFAEPVLASNNTMAPIDSPVVDGGGDGGACKR